MGIGLAAGLGLTAWDFSSPTICKGSLPCIDYTGVATWVYWAIFGAQAVISTAMMAAGSRARVGFFPTHLASVATMIAFAAAGWFLYRGLS
jgi:hypothetical protein